MDYLHVQADNPWYNYYIKVLKFRICKNIYLNIKPECLHIGIIRLLGHCLAATQLVPPLSLLTLQETKTKCIPRGDTVTE